MPKAHIRVFISHSSKNSNFVEKLVERLREHYIPTWYSPRNMPGGYFSESIQQALNRCDWFLVVLSPDALKSEWVKKETKLAMDDDHFRGKVLPVLAESCNWSSIHKNIEYYQLFDYVFHPMEAGKKLLDTLGVDLHIFPPVMAGDVKIPVYIFVGGDGHTVFRHGDIICDGPGLSINDSLMFTPEPDIQGIANNYLLNRKDECHKKGIVFVNNRQVRLLNASWGSSNAKGGLDNRPLRLTLGWTMYYHTVVTNGMTDELLPDGSTIGQKYSSSINNLYNCKLSNPIAINLSIITKDNYIFISKRSQNVQTLPGNYQPAVSGDGQPEDVDDNGLYDPFRTALREAAEECIGLLNPAPSIEDVMFFGLGRWMKTRFPFLFGEIRLREATAKDVMSYQPTNKWEGDRFVLPFTVESVTEWCANQYREHYYGRSHGAISSPIFSLLQSLQYAYPESWPEVIHRLVLPDLIGIN